MNSATTLRTVFLLLAVFVLVAHSEQLGASHAAFHNTYRVHSSGAPVLKAIGSVPQITVRRSDQRYVPMPFDIAVRVVNVGDAATDSVSAHLNTVPQDLKLYGPDAPTRVDKMLLPAVLQPGDTGLVTWTLWHPITLSDRDYTLRIWLRCPNAASTYCDVAIHIPRMGEAVLTPTCTVPDSLHFNEAVDRYEPNPFELKLECVNRGGVPAYGVTGFVRLPANVVLVDSNEPLRKAFPSPLQQWRSGDPRPTVSWKVKYTIRPRVAEYLDFKFIVGGADSTGWPTDSLETSCRTRVTGVQFNYMSWHQLPDSIIVNAEGTDMTPNPFTMLFLIINTSAQYGTITRAELNYSLSDGLSLDPSTPKTRILNQVLAPRDTITLRWLIHVQPRITRRYEWISAVGYDDEGNPVQCSGSFPIANWIERWSSDLTTSEPVLRYDSTQLRYEQQSWVLRSTLRNTGNAQLRDISALLTLEDSSLVGLQEFDSSAPDNSNPKGINVLAPGASRTFEWGLKIAHPNTSGAAVNLNYAVQSRVLGQTVSPVHVHMVMQPAIITDISATPSSPDILLNPNIPNPFSTRTVIRYSLPHATHVNLAIYNALGVRVATLVDGYQSTGVHESVLDAGALPPGLYFCRLESAAGTRSIRMLLQR